MTVEALAKSTLYKITKRDKDILYDKYPEIDRFFRIKLENAFGTLQKRILTDISQSATDRYLHFLNSFPEMDKYLKNYHIASYLGITTESLSRIRKELLHQ